MKSPWNYRLPSQICFSIIQSFTFFSRFRFPTVVFDITLTLNLNLIKNYKILLNRIFELLILHTYIFKKLFFIILFD